MTLHVGIVACSAEGASLCYRTICTESPALLGAHAHPEVTMHTHSLASYVRFLESGDLEGVAELMRSSAEKLANAGADFLICPDNTIHQAMPYVQARSPLPWLHIAEVVANEAVRRSFRRLGLLGTRYLLESDVYPRALRDRGLDFVLPAPGERDELHRVIMDELVYGRFEPTSIAFTRQLIEGMRANGCDGVVLGCTEIPLIVSEQDSPLPVLDSTRLLARAALHRATETTRTI